MTLGVFGIYRGIRQCVSHHRFLHTMAVVISMQGTHSVEKEFVLKELGVYFPLSGVSQSYFFMPPENVAVDSSVDQYVRRHLHGMRFDDGVIPYSQLGPILIGLATGMTVYVKGLQNVRFLATFGLVATDLELMGCPKASTLPQEHVPCAINGHRRNAYCARRRAVQWGKYLMLQLTHNEM